MGDVARYREQALRDAVVAAAWQVEVLRDAPDWLVLPDGALDVVLAAGREPVVAGPATRPAVHPQRAGDRTVGVRLRPGAARTALGVDAEELRDSAVPVAALGVAWREDAARAQEALDAGDPHRAAALLARALARTAGEARAPRPDVLVARAAAALAADPGREVAALARELAVSPRALRRRFAAQVGYGPKRYARMLRLQLLLAARARAPESTAGRLAADAGYADHPHLVRDCRELAGRTPSALLAQRAGVALEPA